MVTLQMVMKMSRFYSEGLVYGLCYLSFVENNRILFTAIVQIHFKIFKASTKSSLFKLLRLHTLI